MSGVITGFYRRSKLFKRIAHSHLTGKRIPIVAHIAITGFCNLRCSYCYGDYSPEKVHEMMRGGPTKEQLFTLIDELDTAGTQIMTILGGEPLLHQHFAEIIDYVDRKGMIIQVVTNAYFVHKHIETLKKIDSLCVSLDGDKEGNDKNRGEGTFRRTVMGIDIAQSHGIPVRINAVITEHTYRSFDWLCNFCNERGIPLGFCLLEEHSVQNTLSEEQLRDLFRKALAYKEKGFPLLFSETALRYTIDWPVRFQEKILYPRGAETPPANPLLVLNNRRTPVPDGFRYVPCRFPRNIVYIGHDGIVHPCVYLWNVPFAEGYSVFEVGFQRAWEQLTKVECVTCNQASYTNWSLVMGLSPRVLLDAVKSSLRLFNTRTP